MEQDVTRIARVRLPDGTPVWARISGAAELEVPSGELSFTDTGLTERVEARVESLGALVNGVARSLAEPLRAVRPDEVSVEFGIELTAKAGKVVGLLADGEAKAAITVTLTWKGDGPPDPGGRPGDGPPDPGGRPGGGSAGPGGRPDDGLAGPEARLGGGSPGPEGRPGGSPGPEGRPSGGSVGPGGRPGGGPAGPEGASDAGPGDQDARSGGDPVGADVRDGGGPPGPDARDGDGPAGPGVGAGDCVRGLSRPRAGASRGVLVHGGVQAAGAGGAA
ncbi:CU044_2847 family protein [Streptomyces sp. NPDC127079]|uniref:CU044_2847 family protein n=1 Tax=Streptomyces sp. NPDC127079 TaxID=3347132 RepID=UPI003660C4D4